MTWYDGFDSWLTSRKPHLGAPHSFLNRRSEVRILSGAPGKLLRFNRLRDRVHAGVLWPLLPCSFSREFGGDERSGGLIASDLRTSATVIVATVLFLVHPPRISHNDNRRLKIWRQ